MSNSPRKFRTWPDSPYPAPRMVPIAGMRDQSTRITYIPWSDVLLGVMGWEMIPDVGRNVIVYFHPTVDQGKYEIRCHATVAEPDPVTDELLGSFEIPSAMFEQ